MTLKVDIVQWIMGKPYAMTVSGKAIPLSVIKGVVNPGCTLIELDPNDEDMLFKVGNPEEKKCGG